MKHIELHRAGLTLRGLLTRPHDGSCPLVLMLHGFGASMDASGGFFQDVSDRLTAAGFATLRLDFNGHGQSEGDFTEMTPFNEIEDAAALLRYAKSLDFVTDIHVLGHSQGGVVAGMLAGYYHDAVKSWRCWPRRPPSKRTRRRATVCGRTTTRNRSRTA